MSYQVFAIKTRPQSFSQVIGQDSVVSALTHALEQNKLHHAYLFTGTRGVGKTTIARIIAKSINCEQGVTSTPCNQCANCDAINNNNFPDLIEIDAASKTKVEDTRALLDTVIYAPTQGRYKVYLIDEVHMLSTHSFNALLKTLEEPPSHVKFLLATTDPQKIPATIVSRCLQFYLRWVDSDTITKHLVNILNNESISYQEPAVKLIASAAQGSVRDALSLLEQAVAVGGGEVLTEQVRGMLGRTASTIIIDLLNAVVTQDSVNLIKNINLISKQGVDFSELLSQIIYSLHSLALYQQAPDLVKELDIEQDIINYLPELAQNISPEDLQIYYQMALHAKRDLPYSPSPKLAVEMAFLRMISFVPEPLSESKTKIKKKPEVKQSQKLSIEPVASPSEEQVSPNTLNISSKSELKIKNQTNQTNQTSQGSESKLDEPTKHNWNTWINSLELKAISLQVIKNCEFVSFEQDVLLLYLDSRFSTLLSNERLAEIEQRIRVVLQDNNINLKIKLDNNDKLDNKLDTPAMKEQLNKEKKQEDLVAKMQNDHNIKNIIKTFNGELSLDSIQSIESTKSTELVD